MKATVIITLLLCSLFGAAQRGDSTQKAAMQKLRWLVGNWSGSSTVLVDGTNGVTNIRESIQMSLDGTILQITVRATDKDSTTRRQSLAYTSFSVISFDAKNNRYRWTSWRTNGNDYDEKPFLVGNNSFEYTSKEDGRQIRYKGRLGAKGEFIETGEYSKDGSSWTTFITMKLVRSR